ncbi:MAG: DegT/DnrJ/EryC1/StrS family aminotransferase [Candidatus Accumulibacter sp.]|jgi:dTDP-4-amino-4,6-dideoxygalactose transaminase|nr:DegT/DnrJ/EryC1/StrS family aminotransferase [Accumulibacter sp.]
MAHKIPHTLSDAAAAKECENPLPPDGIDAIAPIQVTRSAVPDASEYAAYLAQIFSSGHLTNHGPFVDRLETALKTRLSVPHLALCANGTLALQIALRASGLTGKKVITTPFSYVATVSALLWEGCTPVFADIDEETLCLYPHAVSEKITPDVAGVLPVHIYGNACDVDAFGTMAKDAHLTLIYDGAQCFGSAYKGQSVLNYGDYATCSFHATKIFHTVEGGGVVAHSPEAMEALTLLRAFGHHGDVHYRLGINAKLSELHAAMGLALLDGVESRIAARAKVRDAYDAYLPPLGLRRPALRNDLKYNHAYYPVIFDDEKTLLCVVERLNAKNIFSRRYFYPALNTLPYLKETQPCPVAESVSRRVLCLPLYPGLEDANIERIADIVKNCLS